MPKHGKQYRDSIQSIDQDKFYSPNEALDLAKQSSRVKFDETIELHLRTNADPRHADQLIRGVALLPHGLGKDIRVLVFASGEAANIAKQAGADYVGDDDIIVIAEAPDNVTMASVAINITSSGSLQGVTTTPLLSYEDGVKAIKSATTVNYTPPGN